MRDYGIDKGLIEIRDDSARNQRGWAKGFFGFRKMFRDYLTKLNVAFYDPCCPALSSFTPVRYNPDSENIEVYIPDDGWADYTPDTGGGGGDTPSFSSFVLTNEEASPDNDYLESPSMRIPVAAGTSVSFEMWTVWAGASTDYTLATKFTDLGVGGMNSTILAEIHATFGGLSNSQTIGMNNAIPYTDEIQWDTMTNYQPADGNVIKFSGLLVNNNGDDDELILNFRTLVGYAGGQLRLQPFSYFKTQVL